MCTLSSRPLPGLVRTIVFASPSASGCAPSNSRVTTTASSTPTRRSLSRRCAAAVPPPSHHQRPALVDERLNPSLPVRTQPTHRHHTIPTSHTQTPPPGSLSLHIHSNPHPSILLDKHLASRGLLRVSGRPSLVPRWAGGRPRLLSDDEEFVIQTATTRPTMLDKPFTRWSIRKLTDHPRRNLARQAPQGHRTHVGRAQVDPRDPPGRRPPRPDPRVAPLSALARAQPQPRHPDLLAAQRREPARVRSEKGIRWSRGDRPLPAPT